MLPLYSPSVVQFGGGFCCVKAAVETALPYFAAGSGGLAAGIAGLRYGLLSKLRGNQAEDTNAPVLENGPATDKVEIQKSDSQGDAKKEAE